MRGAMLMIFLLLAVATRAEAALCGEVGGSRIMMLPKKYTTGIMEEPFYSNSYALIVGAINYQYYAPLISVKDEMDDLAESLVSQGFKVRRVCDPTAAGPGGLDEIKRFIDDYDGPDNRLLIFLSGHGWVDTIERQGHYAAIDSPTEKESQAEAKRKSLSSAKLISLVRSIQSKHVIVAIDACYSAAIFTQRSDPKVTADFSSVDFEDISRRSRWFITAGSEDEETPSPSIFAPAFILGLSGYADSLPADGIVSATELATYVRRLVANSSGQQTIPRWGHIPLEAKQLVRGGGEPMFRYDPAYRALVKQSLRSAGAAYLIEPTTPKKIESDWPDSRYRLIYYEKRADKGEVIQAMDNANLPYLATVSILPQNYPTNGIACHPDASVDVVRAAAKGLIDNGIRLRIIDRATKQLKDRRYLLQALHFARVSGNRYRDITTEDLNQLRGCPDEFHFKKI